MNTPPLVDPRMLANLKASGYLPTKITIQANTPTLDDYGGAAPGWANVTGLVNLDGAIARSRFPRSTDILEREFSQVTVTHEITISGGYPAIKPNMQATDGTNTYLIIVVWVDSQGASTALSVRQVST